MLNNIMVSEQTLTQKCPAESSVPEKEALQSSLSSQRKSSRSEPEVMTACICKRGKILMARKHWPVRIASIWQGTVLLGVQQNRGLPLAFQAGWEVK